MLEWVIHPQNRPSILRTLWLGLVLASCAGGGSASSPSSTPSPSATDALAPGIPMPAFGIREQAGTATYFVDSSQPAATDEANPQGSATRPRRTIPDSLPAGAVVEVRGGPYVTRRFHWNAQGTADDPVFVKGVGSPVFSAAAVWIEGAYLVVEGLVFEGTPLVMGPGHHLCLRGNEIRGYNPGRNGAALTMAASDVVIQRNQIHHNGDPAARSEQDVHGIKLSTGNSRVFIVDNQIHHNGGDAIQIGQARASEPWAQSVYIGRNDLHDDRENGVDVKQARDVVVSGNRIRSYAPTSSSAGEAVVVHNGPERVFVLNNEIENAASGVVCTGAAGFAALGNLISRIHHPPGAPYDPRSMYGSHGILIYGSREVAVASNTLYDVDAGISIPTGAPAVIVNNIVAGLAQPSHHVVLGGDAKSSTSSHNLLGTSPPGQADPVTNGFEDAGRGDFRLRAGSPAIDAGTVPDAYAAFQQRYGLDIALDLASLARPQGPAFDIGAFEYPAAAR